MFKNQHSLLLLHLKQLFRYSIPTALAPLAGFTPVALQAQPQSTQLSSLAVAGAPLGVVEDPFAIEDISVADQAVAGAPSGAASSLEKPQTSMVLGDLASKYTRLIGAGKKDDADTTFG
jgi:hypothetical protein